MRRHPSLCFPCPRSLRGATAAFLLSASVLPFVAVYGQQSFAGSTNGGGMLAVTPTPAASPTPTPTPADSRFRPAKLLKHPAPNYPELALLNRVEGVVKLRFGIDDQGKVTTLNIVKTAGSVMIDNVVRDPVLREWTFQPATLDDKPIASSLEREIEFKLDPEQQRQFARARLALQPNDLPDPPYPPEAIPAKLKGSCSIGVIWTNDGLVDLIYVDKPSGSVFLDHTALRWAFTHWRIDPKLIVRTYDAEKREKAFLKTVTFTPPAS